MVRMQALIIGREKNLAKAEIESVFGELEQINEEVVLVDVQKSEQFHARLINMGGIIKAGEALGFNGSKLEVGVADFILKNKPEGKINFGISFYGFAKPPHGLGIKIKKLIKKSGRSVRYVATGSEANLNAASVIYNKLDKTGFEFLIIKKSHGQDTLVARTYFVQNINEYSKRDFDKPCRDTKVGMLPPKLSQQLINLAKPKPDDLIIDPFCGSGGLLMEAALMGYESEGGDISADMIKCSQKNIGWLSKNYELKHLPVINEVQDAIKLVSPTRTYCVATEGYLGKNFVSQPSKYEIDSQLAQLRDLYLNFLSNLASQTQKPSSVVVCMPFWKLGHEQIDLNILDEISNLGYTIREFKSVDEEGLRYKRDKQFTGRQIVVLD